MRIAYSSEAGEAEHNPSTLLKSLLPESLDPERRFHPQTRAVIIVDSLDVAIFSFEVRSGGAKRIPSHFVGLHALDYPWFGASGSLRIEARSCE